jgi:endonuclease-3
MPKPVARLPKILDRLESHYGVQEPKWPTGAYEFLAWWHCGYPASDAACHKGWEAVQQAIGVEPRRILAAPTPALARALQSGGIVPEIRAIRLKEIAARVEEEFGGDLRAALAGPLSRARKILKKFPGISDPGADRILLFAGLAPLAAVPSNCPHVLVRIRQGREGKNYSATYRDAQQAIEAELPSTFEARTRAFLLLKCHGQELCRRTKPRCDECPVAFCCLFSRV